MSLIPSVYAEIENPFDREKVFKFELQPAHIRGTVTSPPVYFTPYVNKKLRINFVCISGEVARAFCTTKTTAELVCAALAAQETSLLRIPKG
jgi:hypothetical protein